MYTKEEKREIQSEFYTTFGRMMRPIPSESGRKVRWTNYRTGISKLFVRVKLTKDSAIFSIDLQQTDMGIRDLYWEQCQSFIRIMESTFPQSLTWQKNAEVETGIYAHRITAQIEGVNLYDKNTWPTAFAFFKENLIAFDSFWSMVSDVFKDLEK